MEQFPGKRSNANSNHELDERNIFAAIGRKDADELVARSELLDDVGNLIEKSELTQYEVAKKLGIKQSKVSMLVNGHLSEFSTDTLLHYLAILGCIPRVIQKLGNGEEAPRI